jgi:hypothetical protein
VEAVNEPIYRVTLKYAPSEMQVALDYCSDGKYTIVRMYQEQDGRSGRYTGVGVIVAEKKRDE